MPWFLQVNFAGPHDPFMITNKMHQRSWLDSRQFPVPLEYSEFRNISGKNDSSRPQYSASVEYLDRQLGLIVNKLKELKELEETIICISSDHGDMLGDAQDSGKFKPWIQSTNVPLICAGPGILRGHTIETYVEQIDLAATFLDFAKTNLPHAGNRTNAT
eukprot:323161_1